MARRRRRNQIVGQFSARQIEMLRSHAWRTLSLSAHRVVDRLEIERAQHGGQDNGKLPCTFEQFVEYGIHRHAVAPAVRELEALGFVEVTERGRSGNAGYRKPNLFRITYHPGGTESGEPSHEWRRILTIEQAEALATAARNAKAEAYRPRRHKNKTPVPENAKPVVPETITTVPVPETVTTRRSAETVTTSRVSGGDRPTMSNR
jgi:hypothetical protein